MVVGVQATCAAIAFAAMLGGCAQIGIPLGPTATSNEITGSISPAKSSSLKVAAKSAVDPSDWEAIRRTLVSSLAGGENKELAWSNPDTGSSGTITPSIQLAGNGKDDCRLFATTLSDFRGVRRFRGEICRQGNGGWQFTTVSPDDAALS